MTIYNNSLTFIRLVLAGVELLRGDWGNLEASIAIDKLISSTVMLMEGPQIPFTRDKENDSIFIKHELSSNPWGDGGFYLNT